MLDAGKFFKKKEDLSTVSDSPIHIQGGSILEIPLSSISPNPSQPRKNFDREALEELCSSIKQIGIIQPVLVKPADKGYELIVGERRFRAAQMAGFETIPAMVTETDALDQQILALVENIHRSDLTSIEEAFSLSQILYRTGLTQSELAEKLGRSQSSIANKLRLLKLDDGVKKLLMERKIGERQARALVSLPGDEQLSFAQRAIKDDMSAGEIEKAVKRVLRELAPGKRVIKNPDKKNDSSGIVFTGPDGPTGELLDQISSIVEKGRAKGVPVMMKVRELARNELMVEIKVDFKE